MILIDVTIVCDEPTCGDGNNAKRFATKGGIPPGAFAEERPPLPAGWTRGLIRTVKGPMVASMRCPRCSAKMAAPRPLHVVPEPPGAA